MERCCRFCQPPGQHPHGLPDEELHRWHNHDNIHVRGYKEEGTATTLFDMTMLNQIDGFQMTFDRIPRLHGIVSQASHWLFAKLQPDKEYGMEHGKDLPEVAGWKWQA